MNDDPLSEAPTQIPRGALKRPWLLATVFAAAALFVAAPLIVTPSEGASALLGESVTLADDIMERGPRGAQAQALRAAPQGLLARGATVMALLLNPTGEDEAWSRAIACLLLTLSWWGLTRFVGGRSASPLEPTAWIVGGLLLLAAPARGIAAGDLYGAWTLGAGVLFALTCQRLLQAPESTWRVGLVWGLLTLLHPALVALGIPIFIFAAQAYGQGGAVHSAEPGHGILPPVPLSLIASPAVAALVVLGLWALCGGSTRELGSALDQLWRQAQPGAVTGILSPSPGMTLLAGLHTIGWLLTGLAVAGSLLPGHEARVSTSWFVLATIFLVGSLNGHLAAPEANLMLFATPFMIALATRPPLRWTEARSP